MDGKNTRTHFVPTPEQIAEECEKIREGWSPEKWAAQSRVKNWQVPRGKNPDLNGRGAEAV